MSLDEIQEEAWVCGIFDSMLAAGSASDRKDYLLEHPVLLSFGALRMIQDSKGYDPQTRAALAYLDDARVHLWEHPSDYPLGYGPLEKVVAALRDGAIGFDDALKRAQEIDCSGQLSHTYLRAVMLSWLSELEGDVTFTLRIAEIALEAAWAMPLPHLALDVQRAGAEGFIRLVHGGLMRRPDGRLYARALEIGEWAISDAEQSDKMSLKGEYLHELGTLALDAYAANYGPSPGYPAAIEAWLAKAIDPMPKPADGLAHAREYLSASVDLREPGSPRGRTLKALLEVVIYEAFALDKDPNPDRVVLLSNQALADLDSRTDDDAIQRVEMLRSICE